MRSREQPIVCCLPEFVFLFSVVQMLVGLRKQFIKSFVFPTLACAASFNNKNNNGIINIATIFNCV